MLADLADCTMTYARRSIIGLVAVEYADGVPLKLVELFLPADVMKALRDGLPQGEQIDDYFHFIIKYGDEEFVEHAPGKISLQNKPVLPSGLLVSHLLGVGNQLQTV